MILDSTAILQNFLINGTGFVIFIIFGTLLLLRKVNRLTVTLSLFFFTAAAGIAVNITYRLLDYYYTNLVLNKVTTIIMSFSVIFIYSFNQILLKSERVYTLKIQLIITFGYLAILLVLLFMPNAVDWQYLTPDGYRIGYDAYLNRLNGDIGVPVWQWYFGLYALVTSQIVFGFIMFTTIRLYNKMEKSIMKKKYLMAILGVFFNDIILAGNYIVNVINEPLARKILLAISILVFISAFMLFFGLGKQEVHNEKKQTVEIEV